jgi:hypothetical protein
MTARQPRPHLVRAAEECPRDEPELPLNVELRLRQFAPEMFDSSWPKGQQQTFSRRVAIAAWVVISLAGWVLSSLVIVVLFAIFFEW